MQQPESFPVCRGCGILAPSQKAQCPRCGTATGEQVAWVPFRADGALSVAIEMEFQCRACGHWAPANFLDLDGSLGCAHCGIEQAFRPERFRDVLLAAHDVGDLAGPHPEGHPAHRSEPLGGDNPYGRIGVTEDNHATELRRRDDLELKVKLRLTRGRALCSSCQMPVEIQVQPSGALATVCAYCQERAEYALPAAAAGLHPPLLGVIADEHRSDCQRSETVSSDGTGPVAIQCPSCHAPLKVSATSALANCQYCSTQSVVPARAWARATGDGPATRLWFALFHGPSQRRKRLAMEAAIARDARAKRRHDVSRPTPPRTPPKRSRARPIVLGCLLVVALVAFVGILIWESGLIQLSGWLGDSPQGKSKRKSKKTAAQKAPPPERVTFGDLPYCACSTDIDGKAGTEHVMLANRIDWDSGGKLQLQIYMDVADKPPLYLPLGANTAPPANPDRQAIAIGMACEKSKVALISGTNASGWSAKTGKLLWTKRLGGRYDHPNPPPARRDEFSTWCAQLQPQAGHVSVELKGGKRVRLRIADGKLTSP